MDKVIAEITAERKRQMEVEGWTPKHDDEHDDGSLARAAATYAMCGSWSDAMRHKHQHDVRESFRSLLYLIWPKTWSTRWWKPKNRRRDLIRAAALIVAEIERLDRIEPEIDNG